MSFNKLNNLLGWFACSFAFVIYFVTLEPSNSLWDCSEYIASSVKFQVGHPPGAPLFQMVGALVSNITPDVTRKAFMLNTMSAIYGSLGIMFLFWTITYFLRKILSKINELTDDKNLIILGSGLVGAIGFTFTDTYWFNSVEAEVYAMMNCSTVMVFWLATKWDRNFGKKGNDKWLLLIALIIGLGPSIRFTIMLTIPSIVMMYYFNTAKNVTTKGFIKFNILGIIILMLFFQGLFPFLFGYFANMELFFVNSIGLPFNSGIVIGGLLLISLIIYGLYYSHRKNNALIHKLSLGFLFIIIGFSCYTTLMVRANSSTPINENNPSSFPSLSDYYHRKQYGDLYNFWGPMFTAKLDRNTPYIDGKPTYEKNKDINKYEMIDNGKESVPNFDKRHVGFFPRMFSREAHHIQNYKRITGVSEKRKPTLIDNIRFFILYQQKYMYFRYLFWNFVGKQNDRQGEYDSINGNWISGISFIDSIHAGPQDNLPPRQANNNGRNTYYFLPLLLAIFGMIFNYKKEKYSFYTILLFFLLTGVAIITYTNAKPFEPRERHYVFAVSFWTFAIWMGIGVYSTYDYLKQKLININKKALALGVIFIWSLAVPVILAKENWKDHDRSNRLVGRDSAKGYLDSCEKNGILFVYGDNDTFPLWYMQEVEGYRRDVRVINTSLFETDWYIDQMKTQYYEEMSPVPSQFTHKQYRSGTRDVLYFRDLGERYKKMTIQEFVNFISSDNPSSILKTQQGKNAFIFPTKDIIIPVDKEKIISKEYISPKNYNKIVDKIEFKIGADYLTKKDFMTLDIIANTNWDRPIYFAISSGGTGKNVMWLENYLQQEGLAYKLVPIKTENKKRGEVGFMDTEKTYKNLKTFSYGNLKAVTMTYDADRRVASTFRNVLGRLARELAIEGNTKESLEVCNIAMDSIPLEKYEVDYQLFMILESLYICNDTIKAREIAEKCYIQLNDNISYYDKIKKDPIVNMEKMYSENYLQYLKSLVYSYDKGYQELLEKNI